MQRTWGRNLYSACLLEMWPSWALHSAMSISNGHGTASGERTTSRHGCSPSIPCGWFQRSSGYPSTISWFKLSGTNPTGQGAVPSDEGITDTVGPDLATTLEEPECKTGTKDVVRREIPRYAGIYINGQIQGVDVTFTVDTGATTTILASRVYQKIQPGERPSLQVLNPRMDLVGADGSLVGKGMATFEIRLGPLRLRRKLAVAEISDEALLGADILQSDEVGPADL